MQDFVSEYMSSPEARKKYPDTAQRAAIAYSLYRKHSSKKECSMTIVEFKEEDDGDLIVKGYIATTHLDSGFFDDKREVYIRDRITKETLEEWANQINQGIPSVNKVSVNHERKPHVAGVGIKGTAVVKRLPDGEYGLWVETLVDRTRHDYDDTKYRIKNSLIDSYSIEFTTKDPITEEYLPNAVREYSVGEGIIRDLMPSAKLQGWTLASQPMNEYAVMVKEMFAKNIDFSKHKEAYKMRKEEEYMEEEEEEEEGKEEEEDSTMNPAETAQGTVKRKVAKKTAKPALMHPSDGVGPATSNPYYGKPDEAPLGFSAHGGKEISEEDWQTLKEMKKQKAMQEMYSVMKEAMKDSIKEGLKNYKVENKIAVGNEDVIETKELKEYKDVVLNPQKYGIKEMATVAANYANKKGHKYTKSVEDRISSGGFKVRYFGKEAGRSNLIEYKALGLTTNQNTDTDYLLSAAELQDSFDPVIYNALNQQTVTWNIMNKDDYSNKGNNQVQFVIKNVANATAGAYTGNAVQTGNVTRLKLETKFKKYQAGVEVDGDMIAAARGGPIGDVFAQEVMDSTIDLLSVMNQALFASGKGLETDAGVISFNFVADSATNTTMYNVTRTVANRLAPTAAADTYINQSSGRITLTNLRAAKRQALKDGSMIQNLVFVTNHTQCDLFRGIYDAIQRTVPTSSRFGFEGRPDFDGIPIFEDKDCTTDGTQSGTASIWYLLDLDSMRVAIWVPPTLEMLGKDADSQKGFIKCYWCTYYRAPRRLVEIYGCATS